MGPKRKKEIRREKEERREEEWKAHFTFANRSPPLTSGVVFSPLYKYTSERILELAVCFRRLMVVTVDFSRLHFIACELV